MIGLRRLTAMDLGSLGNPIAISAAIHVARGPCRRSLEMTGVHPVGHHRVPHGSGLDLRVLGLRCQGLRETGAPVLRSRFAAVIVDSYAVRFYEKLDQ